VTQDHKQTRPIIPDIYKTCCQCLSICYIQNQTRSRVILTQKEDTVARVCRR